MRTYYLIINTKGIGGAERRLTGLWLYFQSHYPHTVKLVCSNELFLELSKQDEFSGISNFKQNVIFLNFTGKFLPDKKIAERFTIERTTKADVIHFVSFFPVSLKLLFSRKLIYTLTESTLKTANLKGRFIYYLSVLMANRVDILDPILYNNFKKTYFFKSDNLFMTSNSFVDAEIFTPALEKKNQIVFLGRFVHFKRVMEFVNAIPIINNLLKKNGIESPEFFILGHGPLEEEISDIVKSEEFREIPITVNFAGNPEKYLCTSKVILSLNRENNYPSKSLLEGMVAGNLAVVTDVGTTRMICHPEFSYYIPQDFTSEELAEAILQPLRLTETAFNNKARQARSFVEENFSIAKMAAYYNEVYSSL